MLHLPRTAAVADRRLNPLTLALSPLPRLHRRRLLARRKLPSRQRLPGMPYKRFSYHIAYHIILLSLLLRCCSLFALVLALRVAPRLSD